MQKYHGMIKLDEMHRREEKWDSRLWQSLYTIKIVVGNLSQNNHNLFSHNLER